MKVYPPRKGDLLRPALIQAAEAVRKQYPGVDVHFKFTCQHCGERCTLKDANQLYVSGECFKCGKFTEIIYGGYMLSMKFQ